MINVFAAKPTLQTSSRVPNLARTTSVSAAELAFLLICGGLAAMAVGLIRLPIGVPGHAILRGVLPMALGLAVVPRRSAGMVMAIGAALAAQAMNVAGIGRFPQAAIVSIVALGPVLDIALAGRPQGWRLYLRFAVAGAVANLFAFAVRFSLAYFGWQAIGGSGGGGGGSGGGGGGGGGGRDFMTFWSSALGSFILCGAIAGLISAGVWFRLRSSETR